MRTTSRLRIASVGLMLSLVIGSGAYGDCGKCDGVSLAKNQPIPDNRVSALPNTLRISPTRARFDPSGIILRPAKTEVSDRSGQVAPPEVPINTANYQTFSLFLITDPHWASTKSDLTTLKQVYENFADSVGEEHLAVWFVGDKPDTVDVQRALAYCRRLNLSEEHGPYVIHTSTNPDKASKIENVLTIQFEGMDVRGVSQVLTKLERDLLAHRQARQDPAIQLEEVTQVLMTSIRDHTLKGIKVAFKK